MLLLLEVHTYCSTAVRRRRTKRGGVRPDKSRALSTRHTFSCLFFLSLSLSPLCFSTVPRRLSCSTSPVWPRSGSSCGHGSYLLRPQVICLVSLARPQEPLRDAKYESCFPSPSLHYLIAARHPHRPALCLGANVIHLVRTRSVVELPCSSLEARSEQVCLPAQLSPCRLGSSVADTTLPTFEQISSLLHREQEDPKTQLLGHPPTSSCFVRPLAVLSYFLINPNHFQPHRNPFNPRIGAAPCREYRYPSTSSRPG